MSLVRPAQLPSRQAEPRPRRATGQDPSRTAPLAPPRETVMTRTARAGVHHAPPAGSGPAEQDPVRLGAVAGRTEGRVVVVGSRTTRLAVPDPPHFSGRHRQRPPSKSGQHRGCGCLPRRREISQQAHERQSSGDTRPAPAPVSRGTPFPTSPPRGTAVVLVRRQRWIPPRRSPRQPRPHLRSSRLKRACHFHSWPSKTRKSCGPVTSGHRPPQERPSPAAIPRSSSPDRPELF